MKKLFYKSILDPVCICFWLVFLISPNNPKAEITGQWNFTDGLTAKIGQDLEWNFDQGEAKFGKASEFKVKAIDGKDPMVMSFPNSNPESDFNGLDVYHSGEPNGGSEWLVNKYTIIADLYYTVRSYNKIRALVALNDFEGAQFLIGTSNGVGSGSFSGKLRPNGWYRVALTVDHVIGEINYYINGEFFGTEVIDKAQDDDGKYAMEDVFYLFKHTSDSFGGFISSLQYRDEVLPGSIIEELGKPSAEGIPSKPPVKPYIVSVFPKPTPFRRPIPTDILPSTIIKCSLKDGQDKINDNSIKMWLNDKPLNVAVERTDDLVTISARPELLLEPLGKYEALVKFNDNIGMNHTKKWRFTVTDFQKLPTSTALPIDSGSSPGFLVRTIQSPMETTIQHDFKRAIHQLEGLLKDNEGNMVKNVAIPSETDKEFDLYEVIDFQKDGLIFGHFDFDDFFPGIPGEEEQDTNFSTEILTYLALQPGTHRLGITTHVAKPDQNDEDKFKVFTAANSRDRFAQEVGEFQLNLIGYREGANDCSFDFTVEKEGLYPFRIVYWNKSGNAALEFYSIDINTEEKILINDIENEKSIKSFTRTDKNRLPYVAVAGPAPNSSGNSKETPISIILADDETTIDTDSVKLYVNNRRSKPTISKTGKHTFVNFQPEHKSLSELEYDVKIKFEDSQGNLIQREWSFSVDARDEIKITGYWNFSNELKATIGNNLKYLDGEKGATASATEFGITSDFEIPDINGKKTSVMKVNHIGSNANLGYLMDHGITPNGGGKKVNQYSIVFDVLFTGGGNGWASLLNMDALGDGDVFWRRNDGGLGQGSNGYEPDDPEIKINTGQWHRIVLAVDLAQGLYEKYVDGIYHSSQTNSGLDGRQSMDTTSWLFNDNDGENGEIYVAAIQIRNGKVSQDEARALGASSALGIPMPTPVRGLWTFEEKDFSAIIGQSISYIDGPKGATSGATDLGTTESFEIEGVGGKTLNVMKVGHVGSNPNFGYIINHNIEANGGGKRVNQYSLAYDIYFSGKGNGWASIANLDNNGDGDVFWRKSDGGLGQGGGGYEPEDPENQVTAEQWHRIILSFDLSSGFYTKYLNGKYHSKQANGGLDGRQSMGESVWLFNDNDGENGELFINSIAIYNREISPAEAAILGGVEPKGLPLFIPKSKHTTEPMISVEKNANGVTIKFTGLLESSSNVNGPWKELNAKSPITIPTDGISQFFRSSN